MRLNRQSAKQVLMIRPARFGANYQTLTSNAFQQQADEKSSGDIQLAALKEFDNFVYQLRKNKVDVLVIEDTPEPQKPDAVFPNNWISMHADGNVILYPMEANNRRFERRHDIVDKLKVSGFKIKKVEDLSAFEAKNRHLEGTGSVVFDHINKKLYACLSSRTDKELLNDLARKMDYTAVVFHANDKNGKAIYHTNVMMCIGTGYAVLCAESIADEKEQKRVTEQLTKDGLEVVLISLDQMYQFAGNMLEIENLMEEKLLIMSQSAFDSLKGPQRHQLSTHARLVAIEIPTIEQYGGGSARCMMAEIFLPKR